MTPTDNKPLKVFRAGGVRAAIWTNTRHTGDGRAFNTHRVQVERIYKDADGNFKTTSSLDAEDVPKAILALTKCYEYIALTEQKNDSEHASEAPTGGENP